MSDEKELIIVRGSTPLLAVTLPEDISTSDIATGIISISQRNKGVLISKTLDEMTVDGNKYSVFLKQSETLKLDSTKSAAIQAKFCTIDDVVLVSYIQNIEILPVNNEKMFEQDNPSGDTYEATGESGIEIVPDLVNFSLGIDIEQIVVSAEDYKLLRNKPSINGVVLLGDKSSDEFGIYSSAQVDALLEPIVEKETEQDTSISEIDEKVQTIQSDVNTLKTDAVKSVNNVRPVSGNVTIAKADIGLANVTNDVQVKRSEMGAANGVATLDTNGVIPSAQLPSYVDDVLEYSTASAFPPKGESGKIYIAIDTNLSYRWSGTRYTKIASDLALGETSSTAYAGDKGKAVRDDLNTHVADNSRHITSAERTTWNGKQDKLTAGTNITIDENNVISATGGSGGGAVDSVNGKTGVVVLDADDVGALPTGTRASDIGGYVKPTNGIPKTDLASAVQTSLGKADTALQSAPVTSVNSKTGAVSLTASDLGAYTKPGTGIPKSDLASSVQTSLEKADTALQSAPVNSVNGKTGAVSLTASDVGALPSTTAIPSKTSDLTNDSGFLTSAGAVTSFNGQHGAVTYTAPVTSVNGQTGAVTVSVPTKTSDLQNDSGYITSAPVSSVDGKTGAVTVIPTGGTTGQVLAKASNTDRDVEWVNQSGGGGSSSWTNDETVLASGTFDSTTTTAWHQTYTGVTLGTLRKYKYVKVALKFATNTSVYLRVGGVYLANSNGNITQEQFLIEFLDSGHRFYRWLKSEDSLTIGTNSKIIFPAADTTGSSFPGWQSAGVAFRLGEILTSTSDAEQLRIVNNTAQTGDGAWEIRGAIEE